MSLSTIASKLDAVLDQQAEAPTQESVDGREQALDLLRYVFTKQLSPDSAQQIGEALEAGTLAVETESGFDPGTVSIETLKFLEAITDAFRTALIERMGSDPEGRPDMNPVDFCAHYYLAHTKFPPNATKQQIAGAMRKIAGLPKK